MFYDCIKSMLKRYGQSVTVVLPGAGHEYSAMIHPLRYKNKLYLEGDFSAIGYVDNDAYLYIGPGDEEIGRHIKTARLFSGDAEYFFTRADHVRISDQISYTWAIVRPVVYGEDTP